ncbi:MAG: hypothetical protein WAZ30_07745 [Syntrophorhabdus sp.]|jgi:hypothetical protein|nr:hypothetical protein [Pseudomonadota bacterium]
MDENWRADQKSRGKSNQLRDGNITLEVFRRTVESLSPGEREDLEERYAIMLYSGDGITKEDAFLSALVCVFRNRHLK